MRKQLIRTVSDVMNADDRVVLLLGDIGVFGFSELAKKYPARVINAGVLEQSMVSVAAGLALDGMIPVVHTIAPFLVERAFEQLKLDFGYQGLGGNFISVGASYDYASLGASHHCPGDVAILKTIPNMEIFVPGHPDEFDQLFKFNYASDKPKYYRLSEKRNEHPNTNGLAQYCEYPDGAVIAIGSTLDTVREACDDLNVEVLYTNQVAPFYFMDLRNVVVVEPYYEGTHAHEFQGFSIGVPRKFLTNYGTREQHDEACGLTAPQIRARIMEYFNL